ncbi:hypothetical protein HpHUE22_11890 [Helicobacter pylori]
MRDDNELELIGAFSLSNKLDLVRLELFSPMKMFLKSLNTCYPFKIQVLLQCDSHQSLRRILIFNSNI